jgi:arylsulfatase A-like enzyme
LNIRTKVDWLKVNSLMHVTDWLPTLLSAAGGADLIIGEELDGIDQWAWLQQVAEGLEGSALSTGPRQSFVYNIGK